MTLTVFLFTFLFQVEGNALTTTWWFLLRGECLAFEMIKIKTLADAKRLKGEHVFFSSCSDSHSLP